MSTKLLRCTLLFFALVAMGVVIAFPSKFVTGQTAAQVLFDRDIRPLFAAHCVACHGSQKQSGGLRLDDKASALRASIIIVGNASGSPLYQRITAPDGEQMPPVGVRLTAAQIALIKAWIDAGAQWPEEKAAAVATGKRADHTMINLTTLATYRDLLKVVIHDDHSKVHLLPRSFKKWYPAGTKLSLVPLGLVEGITTQNLQYPLNNDSLQLGYRNGNSNAVLQDGLVCITHERGDLLLMECVD